MKADPSRPWYDPVVRRNPYSSVSYSFGPGGISPVVKWLIAANVAVFLACAIFPAFTIALGLTPSAVLSDLWVWQPGTYMFVHRELFHLLLLAGAPAQEVRKPDGTLEKVVELVGDAAREAAHGLHALQPHQPLLHLHALGDVPEHAEEHVLASPTARPCHQLH